jgi:nucleoside-diphosphate-sugar epimerase
MRIVVTGASGNVGSALVERLGRDDRVDSIVGISRRPHDWHPDRTEWVHLDLGSNSTDVTDDLAKAFQGADAVVHLAWLFQPTRHPEVTWRANVIGTTRVLDAVDRAGVPAVVVASSVGVYSPRAGLDLVDESWPSHGQPLTAYSREKAYVERLLDAHEARHPDRRVVRVRPAFIFQARAATQQRRLFMGPLVPHTLLRSRIPVVPMPADLRLQTVHTSDIAEAYTAAATRNVRGAFNLAAEPVLGPHELAGLLGGRWVPAPARAMRAALAAAWSAHAVPASPQLFDLLMSVPMMSAQRARDELGWVPEVSAPDAVRTFLDGLGRDSDVPTPPLADGTSGPTRRHEAATGVGERP